MSTAGAMFSARWLRDPWKQAGPLLLELEQQAFPERASMWVGIDQAYKQVLKSTRF